MRLIDLLAVYLLLGGVGAVALLRRPAARTGAFDVVLTLLLWPLYVPALLQQGPELKGGAPPAGAARVRHEHDQLLAALDAVHDPTLAALLPSREVLRRLCDHLLTLQGKVGELDEVLAREEFSPARAERLLREADRAGGEGEGHARLMHESVQRLVQLRARAARERDDLLGLCARLRMQVTVLRFAGSSPADVGELVSEILGRVDRLEGVGAAIAETDLAAGGPT